MVIPGTWNGQRLTINLRADGITISIGPTDDAVVFSYDGEGRLWSAYLDGISYRRGLNGSMLAKWQPAGRPRQRRSLQSQEAREIESRAQLNISRLATALEHHRPALSTPLPQHGLNLIKKAAGFDVDRSLADIAQYRQIYKPVGILPPDQYLAVVLQATEGCSFNTCTFCSFYKDRPFHIKTTDEFQAHTAAVKSFLGEGIHLRRSIFLGDANALVIPMSRLLPMFDVVNHAFDLSRFQGINAFLDGFSGEKKSIGDYAALVERGLRKVYIGLESGHDPLLAFLKKPGQAADAVKAARTMKQAGVKVGVIVLLGAGGQQFADAHIRDTITAINGMALDQDDILYFSELVTEDALQYAQDAAASGLKPLSHNERLMQGEAIKEGLRSQPRPHLPRISRYDIREFIY